MLDTMRGTSEVWETYMEAISAMEVLTKRKPIQQTKNIHIRPAVPPLTRPIVETLVVLESRLRLRVKVRDLPE